MFLYCFWGQRVMGHAAQVFSQFPEALRMVAKALAVQQPPIACVSLLAGGSSSARSDAVQLFRSDERVRVFLLSLNAGAQGLTLVRGEWSWRSAACVCLAAPLHQVKGEHCREPMLQAHRACMASVPSSAYIMLHIRVLQCPYPLGKGCLE